MVCGIQRDALPRYQSEDNENMKYLISSSKYWTHNLSRLQSHAYALRQVLFFLSYFSFSFMYIALKYNIT